jgi:hypothetical protein
VYKSLPFLQLGKYKVYEGKTTEKMAGEYV